MYTNQGHDCHDNIAFNDFFVNNIHFYVDYDAEFLLHFRFSDINTVKITHSCLKIVKINSSLTEK